MDYKLDVNADVIVEKIEGPMYGSYKLKRLYADDITANAEEKAKELGFEGHMARGYVMASLMNAYDNLVREITIIENLKQEQC